jgi:hypothetical protein
VGSWYRGIGAAVAVAALAAAVLLTTLTRPGAPTGPIDASKAPQAGQAPAGAPDVESSREGPAERADESRDRASGPAPDTDRATSEADDSGTAESPDAVVYAYLARVDELLSDPEDPGLAVKVAEVADGAALNSALALAAEYADRGLHQVGTRHWSETSQAATAPDGVRLRTCIDATGVTLRYEDGGEVLLPGTVSSVPSAHEFHLVDAASGWTVVDHSFPEDETC